MDGTTAGLAGINQLIPQPVSSGGGDLIINHATPAVPQIVPPQNPIPQPQPSPLTPVYAPPPAVAQPAPVPRIINTPPPSVVPTIPQQPVSIPPPLPPPLPTNYDTIARTESQIENVDLDQMMGNSAAVVEAPASPSPPVPPVSASPPVPAQVAGPSDAVKYYFQNYSQSAPDIPITVNASKVNRLMIKRIVIIAGIIVVLGIGGYFAFGVLNGAKEQQVVPTTTTTTQKSAPAVVSEPSFTQTKVETTNTDTNATKSEAPAVVPTVTKQAVTPPATPVSTPTTPNSGISDDFASLPKYLTIEKLSINAPVEQISLTDGGAIGVPTNIWSAGWYIGSAKPGQSGAVFIDGHSSSSRGALFGNLDTLKTGDTIGVTRNDGIKVIYNVVNVSVVNRHDVDMVAMLKPYGKYEKGLNIMSCVGNWIESENTLENRVLVYAVQS